MKKSSIIHHDMLAIVEDMPDELAGKFVKLLFKAMREEEISVDDIALRLAIHPFIAQFKRDREKYERICERNRNNGAKGGRPKKDNETQENPVGYLGTQKNPEKPKKPDNDSDSDNENDKNNNPPYSPPEGDSQEREKKTDYPPWLDVELWLAFKDERKKLKHPMTERAEKMALNKLAKLKSEGYSPSALIEHAIMHGWRGIFPVKEAKVKSQWI